MFSAIPLVHMYMDTTSVFHHPARAPAAGRNASSQNNHDGWRPQSSKTPGACSADNATFSVRKLARSRRVGRLGNSFQPERRIPVPEYRISACLRRQIWPIEFVNVQITRHTICTIELRGDDHCPTTAVGDMRSKFRNQTSISRSSLQLSTLDSRLSTLEWIHEKNH